MARARIASGRARGSNLVQCFTAPAPRDGYVYPEISEMEWPMLKQTPLLVLGFALMALPAVAKPAIATGNVGQSSYVARCHTVKIVDATGVHWVRRCS